MSNKRVIQGLALFFMDTIEHIKKLLQPILDNRNAELVDISVSKSPKNPILRILVDKEGGIILDECSGINKELSESLENNPSMQGSYILEVSSPGLDRPLMGKRDFTKVLGEEINLYTKEAIEGKDFFNATLDSADDEYITLKIKDGRILKIPYDNIRKAKLEIKIQKGR